ncbi:23S rRNA (uracil(1939)-C(5))-methyltransferase RlmD [Halopseudomonas pelagia]|uniref:23S rRNA (uracil(1939)-C(5))-methyltransferase RlmD n=1 Tax=Halopseudomonas pelagia TaxID=553151 RepID=UPI0003A7E9D2|nr:23S rRNA (uracil(1939)-C(5))-methyltransferase RlmD [Halopseudomonas pelagia]|tara:strand:+ start:115782 stop:117158 length:1377 start_codon:yes stop_codon:yes gene_type:complete
MKGFRGRARHTPDAPAAIGQRIELQLERLAHDGRGIGRWQGRIVFVDGGLPGERVKARVLKARSKLIETRLDTLLVASPERQTPRCAHIDLCGGCSLQHMPEASQLQVKQQALAQQLQHFAGLEPERWMPALLGPAYGYRQRTRLAMRWDKRLGVLEVGYRQRSSNDLVEVHECPVLVPALESLVQALVPLLKSLDGRAGLGHVELTGGDAPVILVRHMQALSAADSQALQALADQHGASCWLQPGEPDTMHRLNGSHQDLHQSLPAYRLADQDLRFEFMPGDFIQVNAQVNQMMVNQALEWLAIQPGEQVLDLFCGVGNFALPLARAGAQVTAVEGSSEMVQRARDNAQNNQLESLHFLSADLSKPQYAKWLAQPCDAVLLDPPRDGAEQLVQQLADKAVGRILYVSCNPATLARDAGLLAGRGYRLVQVGIMDMFPQTAHVEAMALFVAGSKVKPV